MVFFGTSPRKKRGKRVRRFATEAGRRAIQQQKRKAAQRKKAERVFARLRGPTRKQRLAGVAKKGGRATGKFLLREGGKGSRRLARRTARGIFGSPKPRKRVRRRTTRR